VVKDLIHRRNTAYREAQRLVPLGDGSERSSAGSRADALASWQEAARNMEEVVRLDLELDRLGYDPNDARWAMRQPST
jgi:hypothetical protein